MKVPNAPVRIGSVTVSLSRLQNEGSQHKNGAKLTLGKSIKATE